MIHKPKPQKDIIISLKNVSQTFDIGENKLSVLKDVNFDIKEQSFNIIYGPSGSGKSTLLNILTGLQKPSVGHVNFYDKALYDMGPDELAYFRAYGIGIVYQQNYWVKSLDVLDNVAMPLYFSGYIAADAAKKAMKSLEMVGMGQYAHKQPTLLSGGEQQRIALARALVNDPLFIIADEPTGSLDSKNGDMVMSLLRKCQTQLGRTVILVTHNMEYLPYADHLLHIQDGAVTRTIHDDDIQDITDNLMKDMKRRIDSLRRQKS